MKPYKKMFCNVCQKGRRFMLVGYGIYECPICGEKQYDLKLGDIPGAIETHTETKPIDPSSEK